MSGQVDPSVLEKWFKLVSRWQDVEAELQQALEQLEPDNPERKSKSANAKRKLAEIKLEMDTLIASAKPSQASGSENFIAGSIDISKLKI